MTARLNQIFFNVLLCFCASLLFSACSSGDDDTPTEPQEKLVIALFSPGGLGDRGYCDQILVGLQRAHKERTDYAMLYKSPQSLEEAEEIFSTWLSTPSDGRESLLVLASAEYEAMAHRLLNTSTPDMHHKAILLFETSTRFAEPYVYTFRLSMYGASYLAGVTAAAMGCTAPLVMLGSAEDAAIRVSYDGFDDGYYDQTGKHADLGFFADDWTGYSASQQAYERMADLSSSHDYIYPVAGGTNLGVYRYLREHPEGPYTAGMDIDQSAFANNITGSLIKHIDRLIIEGINGWLDHPLNDRQHLEFGLESGYVDWTLSARYGQYATAVEQGRVQAIEKENKLLDITP